MTDRKKLVDMIGCAYVAIPPQIYRAVVDDTAAAVIADHLLANGVIVLPCKVGQEVWIASKTRVQKAMVEQLLMGADNKPFFSVTFECDYLCDACNFNTWQQEHSGEYSCDGEWGQGFITADDIGETVFLTREEAEAALKEGQG